MHKRNVNTESVKSNTPSAKSRQTPTAFKSFNWLKEGVRTPERELLGVAMDVSRGVGLSMQILERCQLEGQFGAAVLSVTDCGILERFSISACQLLEEAIEDYFTGLNDSVIEGSKQ